MINYEFKVDGIYQSVNYYRSDLPLDLNDLPEPHTSGISGSIFTDETAELDKTYYVLFSSVSGVNEKFSSQIVVNTDSNVNLELITSSNTAITSSGGNFSVPAVISGDVTVVIIRGVMSSQTLQGYDFLYSGSGFNIFAKIAKVSSNALNIGSKINYGAVGVIVLRPEKTISDLSFDADISNFIHTPVENSSVIRKVNLPAVSSNKGFELAMTNWSSSFSSVIPNSIESEGIFFKLLSQNLPNSVESSFNFVVFGRMNNSGQSSGAMLEISNLPASEIEFNSLSIILKAK